jgi:two-component system, OmpR family, response regulator MprA
MASRLLVVNDEPATAEALERALVLEGFDVLVATDDAEAVDVAERRAPDAVLVDVVETDGRAAALCRRLREAVPRIPVLLLSARNTTADRARGLAAGADDYIAKPFALVELLTRLRALLRRSGPLRADVLRFAGLVLDPATRDVVYGGRPIDLTLTEFRLLELFLAHPRVVLTRQAISNHIWGFDFAGSSNALNVHVGQLRRKIEATGQPRLIHTVRGVGYVLREP